MNYSSPANYAPKGKADLYPFISLLSNIEKFIPYPDC